MDSATENKATPSPVDNATAIPSGQSPAQAQDAATEKSWGDKYKATTFGFGRNVLLNYIINFAISALGTYAFVHTKFYNKTLLPKTEAWTIQLEEKTKSLGFKIPNKFSAEIIDFFTITQILLCGGHSILPLMKASHDHRRVLEFQLGHKLDQLQGLLGRGNEASKRNIVEYKYIKDLIKSHKPQELTDADKALLAQHHIGDNLQFDEHRKSWWQTIKARLGGVAFTTTMSAVFATLSYFGEEKKLPWIDVKKGLGKVGEKIGPRLPEGLKHVGINNPSLLGKFMVLELLYTLGSKLGFDRIEKKQARKLEVAERAQAEANLVKDRKELSAMGIRPEDADDIQTQYAQSPRTSPALEARRKLTEGGEKDFRTRETAKTAEPSMAL